jgi:putative flippase GtrA
MEENKKTAQMKESIFDRFPVILQIVKFLVIGVLNTFIDFLILNLLIWATGIYEGVGIFFLNIISFSFAVVNSYLWNKYWTFQEKSRTGIPTQFAKFLTVSVIGGIINSSVVFLITTYIDPLFSLEGQVWANVAKVVATAVGLVWNFIGYKFWALKPQDKEKESKEDKEK